MPWGIEIGLVDGQITNYQELKGSIYDVIAAKKAEAALSTMESDYNDAKQEQADITAKLAAEYDKLLEKQSAVKEIEDQMAEVESQVQTEETIQRTPGIAGAADGAMPNWKSRKPLLKRPMPIWNIIRKKSLIMTCSLRPQ